MTSPWRSRHVHSHLNAIIWGQFHGLDYFLEGVFLYMSAIIGSIIAAPTGLALSTLILPSTVLPASHFKTWLFNQKICVSRCPSGHSIFLLMSNADVELFCSISRQITWHLVHTQNLILNSKKKINNTPSYFEQCILCNAAKLSSSGKFRHPFWIFEN